MTTTTTAHGRFTPDSAPQAANSMNEIWKDGVFVGMCTGHVCGRWFDHHTNDFSDPNTQKAVRATMAVDFQSYKCCPVLNMVLRSFLFDKMVAKWEAGGEVDIAEPDIAEPDIAEKNSSAW
jgi:hypothetical protein